MFGGIFLLVQAIANFIRVVVVDNRELYEFVSLSFDLERNIGSGGGGEREGETSNRDGVVTRNLLFGRIPPSMPTLIIQTSI